MLLDGRIFRRIGAIAKILRANDEQAVLAQFRFLGHAQAKLEDVVKSAGDDFPGRGHRPEGAPVGGSAASRGADAPESDPAELALDGENHSGAGPVRFDRRSEGCPSSPDHQNVRLDYPRHLALPVRILSTLGAASVASRSISSELR